MGRDGGVQQPPVGVGTDVESTVGRELRQLTPQIHHGLLLSVRLEFPAVDLRKCVLEDFLCTNFAPVGERTKVGDWEESMCSSSTRRISEESAYMRHFSTSTAATHDRDNRSKSERTVTGVGNRSRSIPFSLCGFKDFPDFCLMDDAKVVVALKQLDSLQNSINNFFTNVYGAIGSSTLLASE